MITQKIQSKVIFGILIVFALFTFLYLASKIQRGENDTGSLDAFAKCLSEKGVVMYGAEWCPHCQNEKNTFGTSFQYVTYVECPQHPQKCIERSIQGYPTWIFYDGKRLEGEQGLQTLSQESGCKL